MLSRLRRPTQRAHRIPPGLGTYQRVEITPQRGIDIDQTRSSPSRCPDPVAHLHSLIDLSHCALHGRTAHPRRLGDRHDPSSTQGPGGRTGQHPSLTFIEMRVHPRKKRGELLVGDHKRPHIDDASSDDCISRG